MKRILSAKEWAEAQWGQTELGDKRLTKRAIQMGAAMAAKPWASLPEQMGGNWYALKAAYLLLNNKRITLTKLAGPHWQKTRQVARSKQVVLFVQDTTELDFTHHRSKKGMGPIGNGKGSGLLLHSTIAVIPDQIPQILGMAYQEVVLRQPTPKPRPKDYTSPEGLLWTSSASKISQAPKERIWVHVGDRGSDDFRFMHEVKKQRAHFLIRIKHNRSLEEKIGADQSDQKLKDLVRNLPSKHSYSLFIPARNQLPARTAQMELTWLPVTIKAPQYSHPQLRDLPSISCWVIRTWEINAPAEVEQAIEWILCSSLPIIATGDALERVKWYTHRWLTEDYHKCLKSGCRIEDTQLDHANDVRRLLGFLGIIALRLLQVRQLSRIDSSEPARLYIDSLTLFILCELEPAYQATSLTISQFWQAVAKMGGHLGRKSDGAAGWQTLWKGWLYLSNVVLGARLYRDWSTQQQFLALLEQDNYTSI